MDDATPCLVEGFMPFPEPEKPALFCPSQLAKTSLSRSIDKLFLNMALFKDCPDDILESEIELNFGVIQKR